MNNKPEGIINMSELNELALIGGTDTTADDLQSTSAVTCVVSAISATVSAVTAVTNFITDYFC